MEFALNFFNFMAALLIFILTLGVIWQSEAGLDEAFKIFALAALLMVIKQLFRFLEILGATNLAESQQFLSSLSFLFLVWFLVHINKVLSNTRKRRKK